MSKPFYTDYVRHALRFYAKNGGTTGHPPTFNTEADKNNWYACHNAIKGYSDRDKEMLLRVYYGYDTLADNVYNTAEDNQIHQNYIWDLIKEFERKVAKRRGLM